MGNFFRKLRSPQKIFISLLDLAATRAIVKQLFAACHGRRRWGRGCSWDFGVGGYIKSWQKLVQNSLETSSGRLIPWSTKMRADFKIRRFERSFSERKKSDLEVICFQIFDTHVTCTCKMYLNLYVHTSYECKKAGVYDFKTLDFRVAYIISKSCLGCLFWDTSGETRKAAFLLQTNLRCPPLCECSQGTLIVISTLLSISLLRGFLVNTDSLLGKHLNYTWQAKICTLVDTSYLRTSRYFSDFLPISTMV